MRNLVTKIKPANGFARFVHVLLKVLMPLLIYVLVSSGFTQLAIMVIVLSKWRMLAVKPRHWLPNIRVNSVDIIFGLSMVLFMHYGDTTAIRAIWAALYVVWLIFLKPRSDVISISLQAMVTQFAGLMALYLSMASAPLYQLVLLTWLITYSTARHFLAAFDETATRPISNIWAFYSASLTWLLGHWLLFYGRLPQVVLLLSLTGYGLGILYYLHKTDRLSGGVQRQILLMMCAIVVVIVVFSDWKDKTI